MVRLSGLRRVRDRAALTQRKLAQLAGLTPAALSRLETGSAEARPSTTRRLAAVLKVKPVELMTDEAGR